MAEREICFVVGPIGAEGSDTRTHSDWLYEGIIKPVFRDLLEFAEPIRADKIAQPGMITTQVIELLLDSKLVIADLSLENANAFYEIGIRHMVQKPIIHMQLKAEAPPFDVSGYRAIKYALKHPSDLLLAQHELREQVNAVMLPEHKVENPVTHARGAIRLQQTATPEQKVMLDELRSIGERLSKLEGRDEPSEVRPRSRRVATVLRIKHLPMFRPETEELKNQVRLALNAADIFLTMYYRERSRELLDVVFEGNPPTAALAQVAEHIGKSAGVLEAEITMLPSEGVK